MQFRTNSGLLWMDRIANTIFFIEQQQHSKKRFQIKTTSVIN